MKDAVKLSGNAGRTTEYFKCLRFMLQNGIMRTNSRELSRLTGISPSQVRLDLSRYSEGRKGYGYGVKTLYREISTKLGAGDGLRAAIIGKCDFTDYIKASAEGRGITLIGRFDAPCEITENADIAIITDEINAKEFAKELESKGTKAIFNMTGNVIISDIPVANIPLGDILMSLSCEIRERTDKNEI